MLDQSPLYAAGRNTLIFPWRGDRIMNTLAIVLKRDGIDAQSHDIAIECPDATPADLIERERTIARARAVESGRPENLLDKNVEGAVNKYLSEVTLLGQPFVKDDKQTVEKLLKAKGATVHAFHMFVLGEGIEKNKSDFVAEVMAAASQA